MTFNTGNNVPSTDPRDLYDNAENLDKLVNGADPFYADRLGKLRESWAGMENSFTNAQEGRETAFILSQADKESRFQAFLVSSGYVSKGDYAAGVVLAERNEYVAVDAATTGTTAGLYRPGPGATLPLTLAGTWATDSANLVLLGDDVLRQELADPSGGATLVARAVRQVDDLAALALIPGRNAGDIAVVADVGSFFWRPSANDPDLAGFRISATGGKWQRQITGGYVTPEHFAGNIQAAGDYAAANGLTLFTPTKSYDLQNAFAMADGLTWISCNTELRMVRAGNGGSSPQDACLYPGNNTKVIGKIRLWMSDSPGAGAYRAHVLCGRYDTGVGISGFTFDEISMSGGHVNCNGFSVAGNSRNIRGKRVSCGDSSTIGRVFMAHWGNFDQHYNSGGTYQHLGGATPTTHPHDIIIDEVESGLITTASADFLAVVCISAGYDIEIKKTAGKIQNSGAGNSNLVLLTAGDLGFAYASPAERAYGMGGLKIGSAVGTSSKDAIRRVGRALYAALDSTPQPTDYYNARISEHIGTVRVIGGKTLLHYGIGGTNAGGFSRYDNVETTGFLSSLSQENLNTGLHIGSLVSRENQRNAIMLAGSGTDESAWPRNLTIDSLTVYGTGEQAMTSAQRQAFSAQKVKAVQIGKLVIEGLSAGAAFAGTFLSDIRGFLIEQAVLNFLDSGQTTAFSNSCGGECRIDVLQVHAAAAVVTPISGGVTVRASGRNNDFYYTGTIPIGLAVGLGDRFINAGPAVGQPWLSIVTVGGVTGSGATVTAYITR